VSTRGAWRRAVALGLGVVLLAVFEPPLLGPLLEPRAPQPFRARFREAAARVVRAVEPDARLFVYIPRQRHTGQRAGMLALELSPLRTTVRSSTARRALEEALLHDYLWATGESEAFAHSFQEVFRVPPPAPGVLYRIEHEPGAGVELVPILSGLPGVSPPSPVATPP
jgi:hypothetical protein